MNRERSFDNEDRRILGICGRVAEMLADVYLRMKVRDYTQAHLAERTGLEQSRIAEYLSGATEPSISS